MEGHMVYTGDRYLEATNILQEFDDTAFDIPKGTTKYLAYYRSNGYSEVGPINTLFAAKPDKTGWTDDTEMNNTHEEQLIYFKSIDDLHDAGYTCVGVLYAVRDSKLYPNKEGETTTAVTDTNGQIVFKNLQQGTYEITEIKTRDGLQLLKEPIKVMLPITMTEDDVKRLQADTSKGVYDDENHVWQFYEATYRITNDATFGVPKAGATITVKRFVPIILGISVLGLLCILVFKRKKHVN